jgi:hypothetical protein
MRKWVRLARWKERFHLQYAPVVGELPALIRLQSLKPRTVSSPGTVLIVCPDADAGKRSVRGHR